MGMFSPDSKLMETLSKITDYIILNLLCLTFSIPIITIGAAFTARNYTAMKLVRGEEPSVWKSFMKSFKENFKQITLVWAAFLVGFLILFFDWYNVLYGMGTNMPYILKAALGVITFLVWAVCYCMFYFEARFKVTTKELVKASAIMALLNFPRMIWIFIIIFLPYVICLWYMQWGLAIWLFATTVSLYYISREFNKQLLLIQERDEHEKTFVRNS